MRSGTGPTLLLGLVLGGALGWLGNDLTGGDLAGGDAAAPAGELGSSDPVRDDLNRASAVTLSTSGRAPAARDEVTGPAGGPLAEDAATLDVRSRARALAAGELPTIGKGRRGYLIIAKVHAMAGRTGAFLGVVGPALEAGVKPASLLEALVLFPKEMQAGALDQLRQQHAEAPFEPLAMARIYVGVGAEQRALELVLPQIHAMETGYNSELVALFVTLDPKRAAGLLFRSAASATWEGEHLASLRSSLASTDDPDAILPFLTRRLDAEITDAQALGELLAVDPKAGEAYLRQRIATSPDAWGYSALANMLKEQGDAEGAVAAFREAARLNPQDLSLISSIAEIDPASAVADIRARIAGEEPPQDESIGLLGVTLKKLGRNEEALAALRRAHDLDKSDGQWITAMSELAPQETLAMLEREMSGQLEGADDERIGDYADVIRQAGDESRAFDLYVAAHRKDRNDSEWTRKMAEVDPERALPVLIEWSTSNPSNTGATGAVGSALHALGRTEEAVAYYERAIAGGNNGYIDRLAQLAPRRALIHAEAMVDGAPHDDERWGDLGDVLNALGRTDEARAAYTRARTLDADDSEWIGKLANLR